MSGRRACIPPNFLGLDEGFAKEFDLVGTRDPSPYLTAPAALALFRDWGLEEIRRYDHDLVWTAAHRVAERWGTEFRTPETMVGAMAMVTLPALAGTSREEALAMCENLCSLTTASKYK